MLISSKIFFSEIKKDHQLVNFILTFFDSVNFKHVHQHMESHADFLEFKDGDSWETKIVNISKNGTYWKLKNISFSNMICYYEIIFQGRWYYIDESLLQYICFT